MSAHASIIILILLYGFIFILVRMVTLTYGLYNYLFIFGVLKHILGFWGYNSLPLAKCMSTIVQASMLVDL